MSETSERDAVLAEFEYDARNHHRLWGVAAMADEIVRQRQRANRAERILAALEEPREAVVKASAAAYAKCEAENESFFTHHIGIAFALLAAIAAAEREVDA